MGPVFTTQHRVWLFAETGAFWQTVEEAVLGARRRVWLSTYIFRDDAMGRAFGELLAGASARGVEVQLLYDPQGSRGSDPRFFAGLQERGVHVRCYRPWRPAPRVWKYFPRDHGRLLLIDDLAFTGGVNWASEWLPAERGGGDWHDVAIGVEGPCVQHFELAFSRRWQEATSTIAVTDHVGPAAPTDVEIVADSPASPSIIFQRLCQRVASATTRVWIENSYCVPPRPLVAALAAAVARGVDVRLLMPGCTDLPIIQTITRGEYRRWLARGIRVFEYQGRVMHSKFAVIDDDWGTIGSFNAMSPGLWWANETNVVVCDVAFAQQLRHLFTTDLDRSVEVNPGWLATSSWIQRGWRRFAAIVYRSLESLFSCLLGRPRANADTR